MRSAREPTGSSLLSRKQQKRNNTIVPLKLDFARAWPSRPCGDWSAFSHPPHQTAAHRRDALCPSTKIQKQAAFGIIPKLAPKRNPPPNTPNAKINKLKAFDLDGNDICPREEYERAHWLNFERCDKNKDGLLDRTEFPANAIVYHDKNKDGVLFVEEM